MGRFLGCTIEEMKSELSFAATIGLILIKPSFFPRTYSYV
jgi:hypothetical protein